MESARMIMVPLSATAVTRTTVETDVYFRTAIYPAGLFLLLIRPAQKVAFPVVKDGCTPGASPQTGIPLHRLFSLQGSSTRCRPRRGRQSQHHAWNIFKAYQAKDV